MGLADLGRIDDVIHGRMRLGIMVYLADAETADFTELKTALEATQGNLRAIDALTLRVLQLSADAHVKVADARLVTTARAQVWP